MIVVEALLTIHSKNLMAISWDQKGGKETTVEVGLN